MTTSLFLYTCCYGLPLANEVYCKNWPSWFIIALANLSIPVPGCTGTSGEATGERRPPSIASKWGGRTFCRTQPRSSPDDDFLVWPSSRVSESGRSDVEAGWDRRDGVLLEGNSHNESKVSIIDQRIKINLMLFLEFLPSRILIWARSSKTLDLIFIIFSAFMICISFAGIEITCFYFFYLTQSSEAYK